MALSVRGGVWGNARVVKWASPNSDGVVKWASRREPVVVKWATYAGTPVPHTLGPCLSACNKKHIVIDNYIHKVTL